MNEPARAKKAMRFPWVMNARVVVVVVICAMAAAVLITARQPAHQSDAATLQKNPDASAPPETVAARPDTKKTIASRASAAVGAKTNAVEPAKAREMESASKAPAVESAASADVETSALMTITGCLEVEEGTFWLKNTSGADAPKSRSWKSGFLRKRSSPIELVDAASTLRLPHYVGQRVAATGALMNREMRPRSIQRVASSCN